jgi:type I restriction enzyme S subunit
MKGWEYKTLESVGELTSSKRIYLSDYVAEGVPFYRSKEIIEKAAGKIINTELFIDKKKFDEINLKFGAPSDGDILITAVGTLGIIYLVKKNDFFYFKDGNLLWLRKIKKHISHHYIYQLLKSKLGKSLLDETAIGTSQPAYTIVNLKKVKMPSPSLPIQRKIAAVLSAYDDLIENNNRRIAILEKMAEELYREWFVRMRFPRHEKVKIVKGLPEGWEVKDSYSLLDVLGGGTPKTDIPAFWDGEIPFFTPKDVGSGYYTTKTEKNITQLGLENCSSKLFKKHTIFITARGTVGKIVFAMADMAMNQSCYALVPKTRKHYFYYFLALRNTVDVIKGTSNSGVFDNIITDSFKTFDLFRPTQELLTEFEQLISPIFSQIESLQKIITYLTTSRDRLLSRLMSGRIDVEHLDIRFPASMKEEEAINA